MILFIGDDEETRARGVEMLVHEGYRTRGVACGELEEDRRRPPALVVLDPGDDESAAAATLETLAAWKPAPRTLLLANVAWAERLASAAGLPCAPFRGKPEPLLSAVVAALAKGARVRAPSALHGSRSRNRRQGA